MPFPFTNPVSVAAPVPPLETGKVPVIFVAATSVTFALVIAPSTILTVVTALLAIVVVLPTLVTSPVKFALVVTVLAVVAVAALPVILPTIGLFTVKLVKVPTLVKLDPITVDFILVPVISSADAAAAIEISALPSNATPLMFFGAASLVAVVALPAVAALNAYGTATSCTVPKFK